jgi:hypothetical protein
MGFQAGATGQNQNSIVLNASGQFFPAGNTGTFINPIRQLTGPTGSTYSVNYISTTNELIYSNYLAGIDYGELYYVNSSTTLQTTGFTQTVTLNSWNQIKTAGIIAGLMNNFSATIPDGTNAAGLTNYITGIFLVNYKISVVTTAATPLLGTSIFTGGSPTAGGGTQQNNLTTITNGETDATAYYLTGSGYLNLTANTYIDLRLNASVTNTNIVVTQFNMNITKIG